MGALFTYLPLILQFVDLIPKIKTAWDVATGNSLHKIGEVISGTPLLKELADAGGQLFPKLDPALHAAAAALVVAHPDATSWLQGALNAVDNAGLTVDGQYGPKTRAAVEAFQTKQGLHVTGMASDLENAALQALLPKL